MAKNYVVWLDSEKAQIFELKTSGVEKSVLEKSTMDHHTSAKKNREVDSNKEHFFRDLAIKLNGADQLLLMGPGLAKKHFKTHLETHHTGGLAKRIIGVENSDHPTDNQILATSRLYYKEYDKFHSPIVNLFS